MVIFSLLNNTVSISAYVLENVRMVNEEWIRKDVDGAVMT
jgi:hypothetical protein